LLSDLIFDKKELIQVDSKDTLECVLRTLSSHNILAAPVFDHKKGQYVGMIDTFDIMTMVALGSFFKGEMC
jgi:predicted transcriptional regulator